MVAMTSLTHDINSIKGLLVQLQQTSASTHDAVVKMEVQFYHVAEQTKEHDARLSNVERAYPDVMNANHLTARELDNFKRQTEADIKALRDEFATKLRDSKEDTEKRGQRSLGWTVAIVAMVTAFFNLMNFLITNGIGVKR